MTRSEIIAQLASKHEELTILTFSVLHVNDVATNMYKEAYFKISKTPLFRLNAKKHLKLAEEARKQYEKGINDIVPERNSEFFATSNDRMDEEIKHYETVLYYQIKQRLDDLNIKYSDVLAKLIECKILTDFAVEVNNQAVSLIENQICAENEEKEREEIKRDGLYYSENLFLKTMFNYGYEPKDFNDLNELNEIWKRINSRRQ